ncbi:S-adenosyl-l-methionine hydroxide adenosyltransferase family protein [Tissierella pigra]|uniref:SAM-dependent chlorinase/fluorinase n=1 Tax=Tissierella pigra TaxID=2607614 RepID=A0A6N7XPL6_9FIRM|nr:S-adenosyl-l-methionine hydroxide adenosyltransferase family protein [Tissierella pigra]MBU5426017.1 S-adenosyl-l-methionine hydroxide adenosyltransferase family protein [Tissierella pigra]MSU03416.1 SAM-dependent chlorinase/fluorinase [Tissierella pigra]
MKPILVFQTDFTYKEGAVCAMYGVVKTVDRSLEIIDGTHEIPQYDIWSGSYRLFQSMKFWPEGTIFVSVVDPGVGTKRKACVARTSDGYYVVTPDNGSLTHLKKWIGIEEVREIDENVNRLKGKDTEGVSIFHGRDLFGYCAAKLASGIITYEEVGPSYPVEEIVELPTHEPVIEKGCVKGMFEIGDPNFGNLWTNILLKDFNEAGFNYGDRITVKISHNGELKFEETLLFEKSFGYAEIGEALIYNNELMKISVAVSQGSFADKYSISYGPKWTVEFSK